MSVLRQRQGVVARKHTSASTVSPVYFGNHILGPLETSINGSGIGTLWPPWAPATLRMANSSAYNTTRGIYSGTLWGNLARSDGVYDWTVFDLFLAKYQSMGVTDLLFTIQWTPSWAGGGTNGDLPPSNMQYLTDFVTAVANRAIFLGFPIKYWECWNEPNNGPPQWSGTNAQMVSMAQAIYNAAKAVDPSYKVLTPSPQGYATTWMDGYLAAGGGAYADIMAFHGYTSQPPEAIATLIDNYKTVFATYGQSAKPIWDTEAFDLTTTVLDVALQSKFLAIYYLLHKVKGAERFYWYTWDGDIGLEWAYDTGVNAIGTTNATVYSWVVGATFGALSINGTVYQVPLVRGGTTTIAVWNSSGASAFTTSHTSYMDLAGASHAISGNSVTIGQAPILLQ